jgi:hypothetical protein
VVLPEISEDEHTVSKLWCLTSKSEFVTDDAILTIYLLKERLLSVWTDAQCRDRDCQSQDYGGYGSNRS